MQRFGAIISRAAEPPSEISTDKCKILAHKQRCVGYTALTQSLVKFNVLTNIGGAPKYLSCKWDLACREPKFYTPTNRIKLYIRNYFSGTPPQVLSAQLEVPL